MEGRWFRLRRPVPAETQRLLGLFIGALVLFAAAGGAAIDLFAADLVQHPVGLAVVCAVGAVIGATLVYAYATDSEVWRRHFGAFAYGLQVLSSFLITVGQYMLGPRAVIGFLLYAEIPIFSFYLLPTALAVSVIALMGAEVGIVLGIQPGYPSPIAQWAFLVGTLLAIGAVFGGLLSRAVDEVGRFNRLRRFLPPQVATALLDSGWEELFQAHRREIAVLFCDLRGFTHFASGAEPEEVVDLLRQYYRTVGQILDEAKATIGTLAGDGLMAYFNDPVPCPDPAGTAVRVALDVRCALDRLRDEWEQKGFALGYGIGIAFGYATLGTIGFEARSDYTALGPVVNLASRLCDEAAPGEILIDPRTYAAIRQALVGAEERPLQLKGYPRPVTARAVTAVVAQGTAAAANSG